MSISQVNKRSVSTGEVPLRDDPEGDETKREEAVEWRAAGPTEATGSRLLRVNQRYGSRGEWGSSSSGQKSWYLEGI